jgi:hypothetical protein
MTSVELKKKLIEKINNSKDDRILEEAFRLLDIENEDIETYKLNEDQLKAIHEARQQYIKGDYITDKQANKEIDEWLKK